jgi:hypothetical protein
MIRARATYISISALLLSPVLALTSAAPAAQSATKKEPISMCLRLFPSGPNTKPPIITVPLAGKKCEKNFKYYEIPSRKIEIDNLNALLAGSFNAGLALGVYSTVQKIYPSPAATAKK